MAKKFRIELWWSKMQFAWFSRRLAIEQLLSAHIGDWWQFVVGGDDSDDCHDDDEDEGKRQTASKQDGMRCYGGHEWGSRSPAALFTLSSDIFLPPRSILTKRIELSTFLLLSPAALRTSYTSLHPIFYAVSTKHIEYWAPFYPKPLVVK